MILAKMILGNKTVIVIEKVEMQVYIQLNV